MRSRLPESTFRARALISWAILLSAAVAACCSSPASHANGGASGSGGATGGRGGTDPLVGAGGRPCSYNGTTYPSGTTVSTGCNDCVCSDAVVTCTFRACLPDGGADDGPPKGCAFDQPYQYGPIGGNSLYSTYAVLTPPNSYGHVRMASQRANAPDLSCTPALPACDSAGVLDVADIVADLALTDVQKALAQATPPSYGRDDRPVDGTMFQFVGLDGHGFLEGSACATTDPACVPPPEGVARLVADLRALDVQQLKDPSCAALQ